MHMTRSKTKAGPCVTCDVETSRPQKRKAEDAPASSEKRRRCPKNRHLSEAPVQDSNSEDASSAHHVSPDGLARFNYSSLEELAHLESSEARIQCILQKMAHCRRHYVTLKAEVAAIDMKKNSAKQKDGQKKMEKGSM